MHEAADDLLAKYGVTPASPSSPFTVEEQTRLQEAIARWREMVRPHGSFHPAWDEIFDAEALLAGTRTLLSGTPREVYNVLMGIADRQKAPGDA